MAIPYYIFQCRWYDTRTLSGKKKDDYGLVLVNTKRHAFKNDQLIKAENASQIYYSQDVNQPDWSVVCHWKPRDFYDVPLELEEGEELGENDDEEEEIDPEREARAQLYPSIDPNSGLVNLPTTFVRDDFPVLVVNGTDFDNPPNENRTQKRAR